MKYKKILVRTRSMKLRTTTSTFHFGLTLKTFIFRFQQLTNEILSYIYGTRDENFLFFTILCEGCAALRLLLLRKIDYIYANFLSPCKSWRLETSESRRLHFSYFPPIIPSIFLLHACKFHLFPSNEFSKEFLMQG